jgi:hypothetical protein
MLWKKSIMRQIAYVTISSDADAANLQQGLDKLAEWESKWLMKFHPEKCNVLTISKKRSPSKYYSRVGLTRDTYAFSLIDLLEMFMFLLRKLMVLLALEQMVLICLPHLRSDEMVHPRYFAQIDQRKSVRVPRKIYPGICQLCMGPIPTK